MVSFKITIVGAGVVGLAIAYSLSHYFNDILVIDKEPSFGRETSSRNSEVIHGGIYYPHGSLKARLCVKGRRLLYEFCDKYSIPYKKLGKLIVGKEEEENHLIELYHRGLKNDVEGLELIDQRDIKRLEPNVKGYIAIHSKETGIIDSHSFMKRLYLLAKEKGVFFAFSKELISLEREKNSYLIEIKDGERILSNLVINSAGLYADKVAEKIGIAIDKEDYRIKYCKGDYFYYAKPSLVNRLIYPLPHTDLKGLGVHVTLDLAGRMKFGPSAYFVDEIDYKVDESSREYFFESASKLISGLEKEFLYPDMAGIRPKLAGEGIRDFIIKEESDKGLEGLINLIGIESPGLTSSLAIGEYVKNILEGR